MIHLTLNQISAYLDSELPEASVELVRLHLSSCIDCTQRYAQMEEQEETLSRLLVNDPGESFFAGFAERVLGPEPKSVTKRTEPVLVRPSERPAAPLPSVADEPRPEPPAKPEPPPKLAPSPKLAPPPALPSKAKPSAAAGGVGARPYPAKARTPRRKRGASFLLVGATIFVVVSAVAVIITRTEPGTRLLPAWAWLPHAPAPDASPTLPSEEAERSPEPGAIERAAARSAEAERLGTASAYQSAALAWQQAIEQLEDDPEELAAGRREVASAFYRAWILEPTPQRRSAAIEAVRSYILCAPPGAQRDLAWTWLARLKR